MPATDSIPRIQAAARALLDLEPDPVPRLRILRDLLHVDPGSEDLRAARAAAERSRRVRALAEEQLENGGWARFHSADAGAGRRVPTTEVAVRRALALGLTHHHPILKKAEAYLVGLLDGAIAWPETEAEEKNDRWPTGKRLFIAATLSSIAPRHPALQPSLETWNAIAEAAFAEGGYDPQAEWQAHCRLTGATTMQGTYLVLNNRYALTLLGTISHRFPKEQQAALVAWVWWHPQGVAYLGAPLCSAVDEVPGSRLDAWFESHTILAAYPAWQRRFAPVAAELWSLQRQDGLWDYGADASGDGFRLSESWRRRHNRAIDHSVVTLLLLQQAATS